MTYSHSVRKSAYDAVRVVLTHGATSSDAAAVQQLVAKLAEQYGMDFVRDVAVELVAELAEVSSGVIAGRSLTRDRPARMRWDDLVGAKVSAQEPGRR